MRANPHVNGRALVALTASLAGCHRGHVTRGRLTNQPATISGRPIARWVSKTGGAAVLHLLPPFCATDAAPSPWVEAALLLMSAGFSACASRMPEWLARPRLTVRIPFAA